MVGSSTVEAVTEENNMTHNTADLSTTLCCLQPLLTMWRENEREREKESTGSDGYTFYVILGEADWKLGVDVWQSKEQTLAF